jgi:Na+/H+-dicarboxylate symporter
MPFTPLYRLYSQLQGLVESKLWARVLLGLGLGVGAGFVLGPTTGLVDAETSRQVTGWLALPGHVFIGLVQMIMIPLIVASIIQGIAGEGDRDQLRRLGPRVGIYFLVTTVASIVVGVSAALLVRPGRGVTLVAPDAGATTAAAEEAAESAGFDIPAIISEIIPANPLASMLSGEMLSIVIFAVIVGVALISIERSKAEPILNLLFSVQEICMTITKWAMRLAPYAVFGLMARITAAVGLEAIAGLGVYILTVVGALLVLLLLYMLILVALSSISVGHFFASSKDVLLLAFSVASSAAVMPLSMRTAEDKLRVPPEVARFVVPVGAIVNMNGTAAYQAIATIFLAQAYGMDLSLATIALVVVTTVAASIGTPSAPGAGIVILATVLASAGIPLEGIALIIGVDHLLGMCRTAVNVAGDLTACVIFGQARGRKPSPSEADGAADDPGLG